MENDEKLREEIKKLLEKASEEQIRDIYMFIVHRMK